MKRFHRFSEKVLLRPRRNSKKRSSLCLLGDAFKRVFAAGFAGKSSFCQMFCWFSRRGFASTRSICILPSRSSPSYMRTRSMIDTRTRMIARGRRLYIYIHARLCVSIIRRNNRVGRFLHNAAVLSVFSTTDLPAARKSPLPSEAVPRARDSASFS